MSRSEQKRQTHQRILDAAGRGFRKGGFGGVGVDGLAKEAGVTSGAFYVHFGSKAAAFRAAVAQGMEGLKDGVHHFQVEYGEHWWPEFVRFYLGAKRRCDLAESCALQSLAPEVVRSDACVRAAFEVELREVAEMIAAGPASHSAPADATAALAALGMLAGAVTLARAVESPEMAEQIVAAAERALMPPLDSAATATEP
ncbi:TetR/AcrR family transcriptional regulator [Pseudomonas benzenivorans]|uniref:TetR/AcrR family transcriptional regulator n=1 Tax=Pseudomonas benzenivorans TaxID=556533 RepID=A0ABY5H998_9PSED|nr:TetR/AcrR family transcriptional regulator [Pseudomonas benzenivorans]UTW07611.1 TetR/AcrR family transcriptional regulator [Pseudomonas benzenivorans]